MFKMARMSGLDVLGRPVGMNMMPMTTFGALFPMWAIMMAAMMLPTMIPTLRNYEALMASADGTRAGWIGVLLGYLVVWIGFAALIAVVQVALVAGGLIDSLGIAASGFFAAALLIVVGAFQFTRAKEICHGVCHSPMSYFLGHWKSGFSGGLRMGLGLGAFCVGCCWGFMVLGFVGGVMSLLWMGLATLFMIFEKLPQVGHHLTKPAGAVLILAGVAVAIASF
jgi:predicted metal-binding membrane protein